MIEKLFVHPQSLELRGIWRAILFWFLLLFLFVLPNLFPVSTHQGESGVPSLLPLILVYCVEVAAALLLTFVFARWFDDRSLVSVGLQPGRRSAMELLAGIFWGMAATGAVTAILAMSGAVEVTKAAPAGSGLAKSLVLGAILYVLVGAFEEIQMRGYPLQALLRDHRPVVAITIVSAVFAALHIPNSNFSGLAGANTFLAGVWLGLAYTRTGRLWLPIGIHTGWNFAMGSLFGFAVSGNRQLTFSPLVSTPHDPVWLSGGDYGPEGGVVATIVLAACVAALARAKNEKAARDAPDE